MTKRSPLIVFDDSEDSPTMDLIDLMSVEPLTRDEYIRTNWMGDYDPDNFPAQLEDDLSIQFRRLTLLETPPVSETIQ